MMKVLGLVRDLFFRSKIDAVANAVKNVEVVYASNLEIARSRCGENSPSIVFADLSDEKFPPNDVIGLIRGAAPDAKLIGFASHVDLKSMKAAKDAGFGRVMSRQEFTAELPKLLS
jgi:DNA-binding NarL/FixJ family response regulator